MTEQNTDDARRVARVAAEIHKYDPKAAERYKSDPYFERFCNRCGKTFGPEESITSCERCRNGR
jgi:hypothetical protein